MILWWPDAPVGLRPARDQGGRPVRHLPDGFGRVPYAKRCFSHETVYQNEHYGMLIATVRF